MKCEHKNIVKNIVKSNRNGQHSMWICGDCGFKKIGGRTYQHKEICGYIERLKLLAKKKNVDEIIQTLGLIRDITEDAINRLSDKKTGKMFLEEVF